METGTATAILLALMSIKKGFVGRTEVDARVQPNEIGVAYKDGLVTLMGYVDSYSKRLGRPKKLPTGPWRKGPWPNENRSSAARFIPKRSGIDIAAAAIGPLEWGCLLPWTSRLSQSRRLGYPEGEVE